MRDVFLSEVGNYLFFFFLPPFFFLVFVFDFLAFFFLAGMGKVEKK